MIIEKAIKILEAKIAGLTSKAKATGIKLGMKAKEVIESYL